MTLIAFTAVLLMTYAAVQAEDFGIQRRNDSLRNQQVNVQTNQQVLPYIVRIIAFDSSGQSFGTGSYIGIYGEYGVILTNWHVVYETEGLVHVHFPSGFSSFGAVIKSDPKWDLALIAISKPPQIVPTLPVSSNPSKPGDPLWIAGYGSGTYRIAEGRCVRYLAPENPKDGSAPLYEIMEVSVSARKGDSGGPILNQKGELAGVLFGSDMIRNTAGSYSDRVNRFLMETKAEVERLPARPESCFARIEKEGPLHSLRESRNAVPLPAQQRPSDFSGSASSFGVRSSSRHYAPASRPVQEEKPQKSAESAAIGTPMSLTLPKPELQSATWAEPSAKFARLAQPSKIVQAAHLTPLQPLSVPVVTESLGSRYIVKLFADRWDGFFSFFVLLNVLTGAGLTYFAMLLLRD